jgi:histidinol dehydrogenase
MEEMKFNIIRYPNKADWKTLLKRPVFDRQDLLQTVSSIIQEVKLNGDKALKRFSKEFDNVELNDFAVSIKELKQAEEHVSGDLKKAINIAKNNISLFHSSQIDEIKKVETMEGVVCWRRSTPIQKVGLYVPGGTAPLLSTVLMLGIPATIAGCNEIIICSPPDKNGNIHPAILYAANLIGIDKIYKVGGSQAIAAMAYGTETIPNVYKIFGPGNQFVTMAKQLISLEGVSIDMPAGPSEVAIYVDETCNPAFVAAEIICQIEHGKDSQAILVTTSEAVLNKIKVEIINQLENIPRKDFVLKSIENSKMFLVNDKVEAIDLINEYAAEHLVLQVKDPEATAFMIENAGSVFLGNYTPVAAGDYASGTNHTLPTNGFAKSYSGVSLDSFLKKITFQLITPKGLMNIGGTIETMAEAEGLIAHKNSVRIRYTT